MPARSRPVLPLLAVLCVAIAVAGCQESDDGEASEACSSFAACVLGPEEGPLQILIHRQGNVSLDPEALATLQDELARLSGDQVTWAMGLAVAPSAPATTEGDLRALHRGTDDLRTLHVFLLVNGTFRVGDEPASGVTFPRDPAIHLYPATLDHRVAQAGLHGADATAARERVEAVVLVHELGHALGLVGCGMPMQRPHNEPGMACHSSNRTSILHARVARVNEWPAWDPAVALSPFAWDADDLADLEAYRKAQGNGG